MTERPPEVEVPARGELANDAGRARDVSAHLWFPGDEPHGYDRIVEANRRVWRRYREHKDLADARQVAMSPATLASHEIGYYDNPHQRIAQLHHSFPEMTTAYTYRSPWERSDARFR